MAGTVLVGRDGAVLTFTRNGPDAMNGFARTLHADLFEAPGDASDHTVRPVVVRAGRAAVTAFLEHTSSRSLGPDRGHT